MEELKGCPNPDCLAGMEHLIIANIGDSNDGTKGYAVVCEKCFSSSPFFESKEEAIINWNKEDKAWKTTKKVHCGNCGVSDYSFYKASTDDHCFRMQCNNCHEVHCYISVKTCTVNYNSVKEDLIKSFINPSNYSKFEKIDIDALIKEEEANESN